MDGNHFAGKILQRECRYPALPDLSIAAECIAGCGILRTSACLLFSRPIGIHSRNWIGLFVVLIPTTLAVLYRIHVEEIALNQAFGDAYASYR